MFAGELREATVGDLLFVQEFKRLCLAFAVRAAGCVQRLDSGAGHVDFALCFPCQ